MADEFTFANVRRVTRSICSYLQSNMTNQGRTIVVSYDTRFLGEKFAEQCVKEIRAFGLSALFCDQPTPTPTLSHVIRSKQAAGGINFTASHNPPEYNGMKFSTADGAPALPEVTSRIEALISTEEPKAANTGGGAGSVEAHDPRPGYVADLGVTLTTLSGARGAVTWTRLYGITG